MTTERRRPRFLAGALFGLLALLIVTAATPLLGAAVDDPSARTLVVSKDVMDGQGGERFTFRVDCGDYSLAGRNNDGPASYDNGDATFRLGDGEAITFAAIPRGTTCTVGEDVPAGEWTTSVNGEADPDRAVRVTLHDDRVVAFANRAVDPRADDGETEASVAGTAQQFRAAAAPSPGEAGSNSVSAWGSAPDLGPSGSRRFNAPLVDMTRAGLTGSDGYWLAAADGGVFSFGEAAFFGSAGRVPLVSPVVGIASTPTGDGYWLAAADGGVFAFGGAAFHGSMGAIPLNQPIVGIAATPTGEGYWLAAADGGVFTFGDARFRGSLGRLDLNAPITGIAAYPGGEGYWLVAGDGGVFTFAEAPYHGSTGSQPIPAAIVDMAASPDGLGYWLADENGQVYPFGVTDNGSPADDDLIEAPTVGLAAHSADGYWFALGQRTIIEVEDTGPEVRRLQRRLAELGYWVGPVDGVFGELTEQAVYAFQKVEGLPLTGEANPEVREALDTASRPQAQGIGDLVEIDKSRQVLFIVRDGIVVYAFNTSTGTEEPYTYEGETYLADTPNGRWEFYWAVDGYRTSNLGRLYRPRYFHTDGIAIHGYSFVPHYPASHGCVRVTNPAIDFIWAENLAPLNTPVWVYGTIPGG